MKTFIWVKIEHNLISKVKYCPKDPDGQQQLKHTYFFLVFIKQHCRRLINQWTNHTHQSFTTRSYLAVVHLGLHDALHVFLLHCWWDSKTVPHAQDLCPAVGVRHLHRPVQDHRPRVQLESKHTIWAVRCRKKKRKHLKHNNNNFCRSH